MKMKNSLLAMALFGLVAAQGINAGEKEPGSDFELFVNHGQKNMQRCLKRGLFYFDEDGPVRGEYHGNPNKRYVSWSWLLENNGITSEEEEALSVKALKDVMNKPLQERDGKMVREIQMGDELWICDTHVGVANFKPSAGVSCSPLAQYLEFLKRIKKEERSLCKQKQDWKEAEKAIFANETSKDLKVIGL
jgi:hypothetical protein